MSSYTAIEKNESMLYGTGTGGGISVAGMHHSL
jgi:hypothetical protein